MRSRQLLDAEAIESVREDPASCVRTQFIMNKRSVMMIARQHERTDNYTIAQDV